MLVFKLDAVNLSVSSNPIMMIIMVTLPTKQSLPASGVNTMPVSKMVAVPIHRWVPVDGMPLLDRV